jgi:hypothetical protein
MRTAHQLATAVMRRLGAIDQNSEPTAAERAQIIALYHDKYAELKNDELVFWENSEDDDEAEIPKEVFGALTRIMVEEFASTVGEPIPSEQLENGMGPVSIGVKGMHMLRRIVARRPSGVPTKAEYF